DSSAQHFRHRSGQQTRPPAHISHISTSRRQRIETLRDDAISKFQVFSRAASKNGSSVDSSSSIREENAGTRRWMTRRRRILESVSGVASHPSFWFTLPS